MADDEILSTNLDGYSAINKYCQNPPLLKVFDLICC